VVIKWKNLFDYKYLSDAINKQSSSKNTSKNIKELDGIYTKYSFKSFKLIIQAPYNDFLYSLITRKIKLVIFIT